MQQQLTNEKIVKDFFETARNFDISPELHADTQQYIAEFEDEHTPLDKPAGHGAYTFRSQADENRAVDFSHAHFLVDRYLTAMVRHMRADGIYLGEHSDFTEFIRPLLDEKLAAIIDHELAKAKQTAQPATPADFANGLLKGFGRSQTRLANSFNPEPQEAA